MGRANGHFKLVGSECSLLALPGFSSKHHPASITTTTSHGPIPGVNNWGGRPCTRVRFQTTNDALFFGFSAAKKKSWRLRHSRPAGHVIRRRHRPAHKQSDTRGDDVSIRQDRLFTFLRVRPSWNAGYFEDLLPAAPPHLFSRKR